MATTRNFVLHDNLIGGVETSLPAHLVPVGMWRTCHNMRMTPALKQVPRKKVHDTMGNTDIIDITVIPSLLPSHGKFLLFFKDSVKLLNGAVMASGLSTDTRFRRWATEIYNGAVYYTNDLNKVRMNNGSSDGFMNKSGANTPSGRYLKVYYDHLVVGYPTFNGSTFPDRVMWSHLYDFRRWLPDAANEADFYDFVEWQQKDYPFTGITGMEKLRGALLVYTPTSIIPLRYVGKPKVMVADDQGVVTRCGNTFPYGLVALDTVHFFYDGVEKNFFAFNGGQPEPIGASIRDYFNDRINTDPALAQKTWAYVDTNNREIWWIFVSNDSDGEYDQAVVFNYRLKRWFTASVENVQAFCFRESISFQKRVADLTGTVGALSGPVYLLGTGSESIPKLYGTSSGRLLTDELESDPTSVLLPADDPVLETPDFHYGDISTKKECDAISINAAWNVARDPAMKFNVQVKGREYLDDPVDWSDPKTKVGEWSRNLPEKWVTFEARNGKVLRYRFVATDARGLKMSAFEDAVYAIKAEK